MPIRVDGRKQLDNRVYVDETPTFLIPFTAVIKTFEDWIYYELKKLVCAKENREEIEEILKNRKCFRSLTA